MSYIINPQAHKKITLNESNEARSIAQNIAIILSTRQGSIPFYRDFGLPMRYIDKPVNVAKTIMRAEVEDAVRAFEPRASIIGVSFEVDAKDPGKLIPVLEVEING